MFNSKKLEQMKIDALNLIIDAYFNQLYEDI